jgi:GNAT superfamily N-acetyltransferase
LPSSFSLTNRSICNQKGSGVANKNGCSTNHASENGDAPSDLAFGVKPGLRRRGIGAALLTQLVKVCPEQSTISIRASANNPAVRFYERFGFKIVKQGEGSITMRREA